MNQPIEQWRGEFGDAYSDRNAASEDLVLRRTRMWGRFLPAMEPHLPRSVFEIGCNVGLNFRALQRLISADMYGLEPNASARQRLFADGVLRDDRVFEGSADKLPVSDGFVELAFAVGVLIHIHPDQLGAAVDELVRVSSRFVLISEYFADQPETKTYRGHEGLLFKRDFGAFLWDRHPDLHLVDYGFLWNRAAGVDNQNWWLFHKA